MAKINFVMDSLKRQSGASLLEVMIALFILGFGLLGLGATQSRNIMMNQSVYYRSIAVDLGNDLADRMRALRTPYLVSAGANPAPAKPPDFAKCSPAPASCASQDGDRNTYRALMEAEMREWNSVLTSQLPNASFTLSSTASFTTDYYRYVLTITWLDDRNTNTNTSYSVVIE